MRCITLNTSGSLDICLKHKLNQKKCASPCQAAKLNEISILSVFLMKQSCFTAAALRGGGCKCRHTHLRVHLRQLNAFRSPRAIQTHQLDTFIIMLYILGKESQLCCPLRIRRQPLYGDITPAAISHNECALQWCN